MNRGAGTDTFNRATSFSFTADVPASAVDTTGVDYYFRLTDGQAQAFSPGTTYEGWYAPRNGEHVPGTFYHAHVYEPPRIAHVPQATAPYRRDIPITVNGVCS